MNRQRLDDTSAVTSFADLEALEEALVADDPRRDRVVANIGQFLLASGRSLALVDAVPGGLTRYSTSREGQNYEPGTELISLAVTRITVLRVDGEALTRREPVVLFTVVGDEIEVDWATADS